MKKLLLATLVGATMMVAAPEAFAYWDYTYDYVPVPRQVWVPTWHPVYTYRWELD